MKQEALSALAPGGALRAAINLGNRALVERVDGELRGLSPALARRLADEIGVPLSPVLYDGAGKVFADAKNAIWDVAFLAVDPVRAETVAFTRPYHAIEATFAVRAASPVQRVADADRSGQSILVATGSAYDLHLLRGLTAASLHRGDTPGETFDLFRAGRCDLVAGVRASLETAFGNDADYRVLPDSFLSVPQAMVLPAHDQPLLAVLDDFVARAIEDGFVARQGGSI